MNRTNLRILPAALLLTLTTACSTSPQFQASEAALAGDPVAMWQEGQQAVTLGEAEVARGEERVQSGERIVEEGEKLVNDGTNLVNVSGDNYRRAVRDMGEAESAEQLRQEINKLRDIMNAWQEGHNLISRGTRRIEDGNERVEEGRRIMFDGQNLMATGRTMMQSSEQLRQTQEALMMERETRGQGLDLIVTPGNPATSTASPARAPVTGQQPAADPNPIP